MEPRDHSRQPTKQLAFSFEQGSKLRQNPDLPLFGKVLKKTL